MFKGFCHRIRTKISFTSIYHPQSNGVVERANALIFDLINKILEGEKKGKWTEVMSKAVRSHNTMVYGDTNFTPLRLLFRAKALLPEEIKHQSLRTIAKAPSCPSEADEKDLLELERLKVVSNQKKYQDETTFWRDPKIKKESSTWVT
jgi:hypothetical protein